ncbi:transcription factor nf-Y alpha, putative [Entamoeba invadens IP1]|uniref:Nuclear transcription factor Y subunit n=1 Tax=Entamoeba invadens IP1 TaxID=370355 RepID=A0A0A1UEI2_ENTIV|nr:transcription factor nf-Y alpha, putative [Entamoeba invadens IP1]ELP94893.1 transcription factor nf-Y alpha, putative [Entamoeba invadens IP1]|eukprot:XP_004261664.1 transcription factor nf-Y alpha, putative [Entamoeba invadens IP1]
MPSRFGVVQTEHNTSGNPWNLLPSAYRASFSKNQTNIHIGTPKDAIHWSSSDPTQKYVFVNEKQFERIMKRRKEREDLYGQFGFQSASSKPRKFKYESRHRHAVNRQRGDGGRFCSKKKSEVNTSTISAASPQQNEILAASDTSQISPIAVSAPQISQTILDFSTANAFQFN